MDSLGERVTAEREAREWSQTRLAAEVTKRGHKIGQSAIGNIEARGESDPKCIVELAGALGLNPRWLKTGRGEKYAIRPQRPDHPPDRAKPPTPAGQISIAELAVYAPSGDGGDGERGNAIMANEEAGQIVGVHTYPIDSFREAYGVRPDGIRIIAVRGDSMTPALWPGQRVMVDTTDRVPTPPGVFVVWDGLGLVLKRVEIIANTEPLRVRISSDNGKYQAYEREIEEAHINGRVIGVWARL